MYPWLVFLHVISVYGFLMAHGVSAGVFFALRRERNSDRIRVLLEMARGAYGVAMLSLVTLFVTGIITGFTGQWWSRGWIWVSLILLIVLSGVMGVLGSRILNEARLGLGLRSTWNQSPGPEPMSAEALDALLNRAQPARLALIGFGGLAIIAWLMLFKPF
jgi:hypothetical protein